MAIRKLYICDFCGKEKLKDEAYRVKFNNSKPPYSFSFIHLLDDSASEMIYCKNCISSFNKAIEELRDKSKPQDLAP